MTHSRRKALRATASCRGLVAATSLCAMVLLVGCQDALGPRRASSGLTNPFSSSASKAPSARLDASKEPDPVSERQYAQRFGEARALEDSRQLDEAAGIYLQLSESNPDRYEAFYRLGVVADRQKRYRHAQAFYSEAILLEPTNADLFNDLGYCLSQQGKFGKAESALRKAVALDANNPRFRINLGMVCGHLDQEEKALEQFRVAGGEAEAQHNLAFIRSARGDFQGAKQCFVAALTADPTFEPARDALKSFSDYDRNPKLHEDMTLTSDGTRWEPYIEGSMAPSGETRQASYVESPSGAGRTPRPKRPNAQQAFENARDTTYARFGEQPE